MRKNQPGRKKKKRLGQLLYVVGEGGTHAKAGLARAWFDKLNFGRHISQLACTRYTGRRGRPTALRSDFKRIRVQAGGERKMEVRLGWEPKSFHFLLLYAHFRGVEP